jgi:hypothetical protein
MVLSGQVDYYPSSPNVAVRILYLDPKARILWLGYDSGRVEAGRPYLVLSDRLLWSDPAGYIPLPSETSLEKGPPPLRTPHALLPSGEKCFSCRFYEISRNHPNGRPLLNRPVRSPRGVDSSLGLLPAGDSLGIFLGHRSFLCRVPAINGRTHLSDCHSLLNSDLPLAGVWWANRLAYLFPPGSLRDRSGHENARWEVVAVNPAYLQEKIEKLSPGEPFPLGSILGEKGESFVLPLGSKPREQTFSSDGADLFLFGKTHLYRLSLSR